MNLVRWICIVLVLVACNRRVHTARFVLLPDTQTYAEKYPEVLDSQIAYIIQNAPTIDLVLQQGDLTQNNNDKEWQVINKAFSSLDNKVPYVLAAGNHDMGSEPGKFADNRNTTLYNQYFPFSRMSRLPLFGGAYENKMENAYYLLTTGRIKWLILTLEFGPRQAVVDWAKQVVQQHPDRTVVLNTHAYMYSDSTRQSGSDYWRPQAYGVGKDSGTHEVHDGEQLWEELVKPNRNIRWVFSGHVLNTGVGTLVSINQAGYPVYQMLANYQEGVRGSVKGGNGWLRILEMNFKKQTAVIKTYSPYIKQYMDHPAHSFVMKHVYFEPGNEK